jgi:hypothetical protein
MLDNVLDTNENISADENNFKKNSKIENKDSIKLIEENSHKGKKNLLKKITKLNNKKKKLNFL